MGLRTKILSGFLILATMLVVAGAWSIYELRHIGISAQSILDENYKSIDAAKGMLDALEREDSATLLLLLGRREEGLSILKVADSQFLKALEVARSNVTIPGEQGYVDAIVQSYTAYREVWLDLAGSGQRREMAWYFQESTPVFTRAKAAVSDLMNLNQQAMYQTASQMEGRAHRATMPGIIAMASAFVFAFLFSFLINLYVITPILRLTEGIKAYLEGGQPLKVGAEGGDEIAKLVSLVTQMIEKPDRRV